MGILQIHTDVAGQIGINPRRVKIISSDNLATVTAAGYLNTASLEGFSILNTDVIDIWYGAVATQSGISSPGTYEVFTPSISNGIITLVGWSNPGNVLLPVVSGDFAVFNGTTGQIKDAGYLPSNAAKTNVVMANGATILNHIATYSDTAGTVGEDAATAINGGNIQAGLSGTAGTLGSFPAAATSGELLLAAVTNSSGNFNTTVSNASAVAQSQVISIPDSGAATANFILSKSGGTQHITAGNLQVDAGNLLAGISTGGINAQLQLFPTTASNGSFIVKAVNNAGNFASTFSNTNIGQATVYSLPDPGAATANVLLDTGTNASGTFTVANIINLKYGATPVAQVDPASCTITAAAGAANHCTITIQLKDGSATNMTRVIPFKVYLATDATGLTLQSAASTGYSVTSGGVKDPTGNTTITQGLAAFSSATGGCVIDLLDTGKGTGNLILMLPSGFKASAAITAGSYG